MLLRSLVVLILIFCAGKTKADAALIPLVDGRFLQIDTENHDRATLIEKSGKYKDAPDGVYNCGDGCKIEVRNGRGI